MSQLPLHVLIAREYGIIRLGLTLEDYLVDAVNTRMSESVAVWGYQGSGKSSRMLQMLFWIYRPLSDSDDEAWEKVLDSIIFKPSELVERLEAIPDDEVIPALGWDDVLVHYPSSRFKTNIREYEAIDSTWAALRTKVSVVILTLPIIDRLPKNLKDNISFEIFIGRNQKEMIKRVFHLPGTDAIASNFFKVTVEKPEEFDLFMTPKSIWDRYWRKRLRLTREALETLRGATDMDSTEGYLPVKDAALLVGVNPNTLQQSISRGVYRGRKFKGLLYIQVDDLNQYLKAKDRPLYTPHESIVE